MVPICPPKCNRLGATASISQLGSCLLETALRMRIRREQTVVAALEKKYAALEAKLRVMEKVNKAEGLRSVTEVAKFLNVKKRYLFQFMHENGWFDSPINCWGRRASQEMLRAGLLDRIITTEVEDGQNEFRGQILVTAKGLAALAGQLGLLPEINDLTEET